MKILIADDYKKSRDELEKILENKGYKVRVAKDGSQALAFYNEEQADIVFIDWDMPGIGGLELCQKIRDKDSATGHISYIILVSGKNVARNLIEGMDAGAEDFIMKPYSADIVLSRIAIAKKILQAKLKNPPDAKSSIEKDTEPVVVLNKEHVLIHRMTGVLEIVANMLDEGVPLPKKLINWAASSIFLLNWDLHERKEYYYIERFIERAKIIHGKTTQLYTRSSLTQIMREHELIKDILIAVQKSASEYDDDNRKSMLQLKNDISRYLTLIRFHAAREEDVFLPFTQRYFTDEDIVKIMADFKMVEDKIGTEKIEARMETVQQLEKILRIKENGKF